VKGNITEGLLKSWPEPQLKIDMSNAGIVEENDKVKSLIKETYVDTRKVWEELVNYLKWRNEELSRVLNPTPGLLLERTKTVVRHERREE
jgi:hypothetical protein